MSDEHFKQLCALLEIGLSSGALKFNGSLIVSLSGSDKLVELYAGGGTLKLDGPDED